MQIPNDGAGKPSKGIVDLVTGQTVPFCHI